MESRNMLNKSGNPKFPFYLPQDFYLESQKNGKDDVLPEVLVLTTFPPRQCGIATYSEDLIEAMEKQFVYSFDVKVCALETNKEKHSYESPKVKYVLNTSDEGSYTELTQKINADENIKVVLLQHEFGLFSDNIPAFNAFMSGIRKPVVVVFHTVLPRPDDKFKANVQHILDTADGIIVMTDNAAEILSRDYTTDASNYRVVPQVVVRPRHADELDAILDASAETGAPVSAEA
ncbi:MAG: hypothetical protein EOP06_29075, partial [Proteobacteria bacterium]